MQISVQNMVQSIESNIYSKSKYRNQTTWFRKKDLIIISLSKKQINDRHKMDNTYTYVISEQGQVMTTQ